MKIVIIDDDPMLGKAYILENDIDTVFLDINFRGVTGLEIAEKIY